MRIGLIRKRFSPTGGAERYLERLAGELQERGHEVLLICEEWQGTGSNVPAAVHVRPWTTAKVADLLLKGRIKPKVDVTLSLERIPGCDLYRAGDGVHAEWLRQRSRYSPLLGRWRNWIKRKNREILEAERGVFGSSGAKLVIANSEMVKRDIIAHFDYPEHRIRVVRNGIPVERFASGNRTEGRRALGLAQDAYVVLLVGAGAERKGVAYARRAVSGMKNTHLVVIDSPQTIPMPDIYAAADVFLLPTLYDPFANVTLEALASGLPVVTTTHNGGHEILTEGQNGFILQRADAVEEMRGYLERLKDHEMRETMAAQAQELGRRFDLSRNVDATLQVCEEVATKKALC
ncbi:MAG: glycosyltransferase family 4 protein [Verrucomicrobiota bacterium]